MTGGTVYRVLAQSIVYYAAKEEVIDVLKIIGKLN